MSIIPGPFVFGNSVRGTVENVWDRHVCSQTRFRVRVNTFYN